MYKGEAYTKNNTGTAGLCETGDFRNVEEQGRKLIGKCKYRS